MCRRNPTICRTSKLLVLTYDQTQSMWERIVQCILVSRNKRNEKRKKNVLRRENLRVLVFRVEKPVQRSPHRSKTECRQLENLRTHNDDDV